MCRSSVSLEKCFVSKECDRLCGRCLLRFGLSLPASSHEKKSLRTFVQCIKHTSSILQNGSCSQTPCGKQKAEEMSRLKRRQRIEQGKKTHWNWITVAPAKCECISRQVQSLFAMLLPRISEKKFKKVHQPRGKISWNWWKSKHSKQKTIRLRLVHFAFCPVLMSKLCVETCGKTKIHIQNERVCASLLETSPENAK